MQVEDDLKTLDPGIDYGVLPSENPAAERLSTEVIGIRYATEKNCDEILECLCCSSGSGSTGSYPSDDEEDL